MSIPTKPNLPARQWTREQQIALHRIEGEPQTMTRVQGMIEERWPGRSSVTWIENAEPRRHVAVTFARERVEGAAATWLDAMDALDEERRRRKIGY